MGIYSMGTTAGQMIGPFLGIICYQTQKNYTSKHGFYFALGGVLSHTLGWRYAFINVQCLIPVLKP